MIFIIFSSIEITFIYVLLTIKVKKMIFFDFYSWKNFELLHTY